MKKSNNHLLFLSTLALIILVSLSSILLAGSEINIIWFSGVILILSITSLMIYDRNEMTVRMTSEIKPGTKFIKISKSLPMIRSEDSEDGFLTQIQIREVKGLSNTYLLWTIDRIPGNVDQWHVKTTGNEFIAFTAY